MFKVIALDNEINPLSVAHSIHKCIVTVICHRPAFINCLVGVSDPDPCWYK